MESRMLGMSPVLRGPRSPPRAAAAARHSFTSAHVPMARKRPSRTTSRQSGRRRAAEETGDAGGGGMVLAMVVVVVVAAAAAALLAGALVVVVLLLGVALPRRQWYMVLTYSAKTARSEAAVVEAVHGSCGMDARKR